MMIMCHITCNFKSIFNKAERTPNKNALEDEESYVKIENKTGKVRATRRSGAFTKLLLQ
jgi:hypothetical protein